MNPILKYIFKIWLTTSLAAPLLFLLLSLGSKADALSLMFFYPRLVIAELFYVGFEVAILWLIAHYTANIKMTIITRKSWLTAASVMLVIVFYLLIRVDGDQDSVLQLGTNLLLTIAGIWFYKLEPSKSKLIRI